MFKFSGCWMKEEHVRIFVHPLISQPLLNNQIYTSCFRFTRQLLHADHERERYTFSLIYAPHVHDSIHINLYINIYINIHIYTHTRIYTYLGVTLLYTFTVQRRIYTCPLIELSHTATHFHQTAVNLHAANVEFCLKHNSRKTKG